MFYEFLVQLSALLARMSDKQSDESFVPAQLTRSYDKEITQTTVRKLIDQEAQKILSSNFNVMKRLTDLNHDIEQLKSANSAKLKELYAKYAPKLELFDPFVINDE